MLRRNEYAAFLRSWEWFESVEDYAESVLGFGRESATQRFMLEMEFRWRQWLAMKDRANRVGRVLPARCLYCDRPLEINKIGAPRKYCPDPADCRHRAKRFYRRSRPHAIRGRTDAQWYEDKTGIVVVVESHREKIEVRIPWKYLSSAMARCYREPDCGLDAVMEGRDEG